MYTVAKVLHEARTFLKINSISSWCLDAEILLMHVLSYSREDLIVNYNQNLSDIDYNTLQKLLKKRSNRVPISHLIGKREFWSNDFIVTDATLDPRSDSETLIEAVLNYFPNKSKNYNILDLGTGSGCLLLTLLMEYRNSRGIGIDISKKALDISLLNSASLNLEDRANFICSNWSSGMKAEFDIIVTNPPYIKTSDIELLQPEVKNYEPVLALDGGFDGLRCYNDIIPDLKSLLSSSGVLFLEHGKSQETEILDLLKKEDFIIICQKRDLNKINRVIVAGY